VRRRRELQKVSERRGCRVLDPPRVTQRYPSRRLDDEPRLLREMRVLARRRPPFGAERIHRWLLARDGQVNRKRVYRLWNRENMQVPIKEHRRRRFSGGSENSCVRRRAEHNDHVWSYDFLTDRTEDGRQLRRLAVIDETTRDCLVFEMARSFTAQDMTGVLQYLFAVRGTPKRIRSDNGPKFVAKTVRCWLQRSDVKTLFITKASPWGNGCVESAGGKLRDELLNRVLFLRLEEARWVIDRWRLNDNHHRIHSTLDYQTPAGLCGLTCSSEFRYAQLSRIHASYLTLTLSLRLVQTLGGWSLALALQNRLAAWRCEVGARMPTINLKANPQCASDWWNRRMNKPLDIEALRNRYDSKRAKAASKEWPIMLRLRKPFFTAWALLAAYGKLRLSSFE